jgi:hypothetical protein
MRAALNAGILVAAVLALTPAAHGFCIYNDSNDADIHAVLVPTPAAGGGKVYQHKVEPGKESCCNPKNAECNPDRVADNASVTFEAKVVPRIAGAKPVDLGCGKPTANPRFRSRAEVPAPVRGTLRFAPNPRFNRGQPEGGANPRYTVRILSPENVQIAIYACFPGAPA